MHALVIPFMALLHRWRGGYPLPYVRNIFVAGPALGLVLWLLGWPWPQAFAWGAGYLLWGIPAWSRWLSLDHVTPASGEGRPIYPDEAVIEWLGRGEMYACLVLRFGLYLIPLAISLGVLGVNPALLALIPAFIVPITLLAWRVHPSDPFMPEELAVGCLWGVAIWSSTWI